MLLYAFQPTERHPTNHGGAIFGQLSQETPPPEPELFTPPMLPPEPEPEPKSDAEAIAASHVTLVVTKLQAALDDDARRDIMRAYIRGLSVRQRREALTDIPAVAPEYLALYKRELGEIEQEEYESRLFTRSIISGGVGATAGGAVALVATGKLGWSLLGVLLGGAIGYGAHYFYMATQNGRILKG